MKFFTPWYFCRHLSVHTYRGYPIQPTGGLPLSQVRMEGTLFPGQNRGVPPSQVRMGGTLILVWVGVLPHWQYGGSPHPDLERGSSPCPALGWGYISPDLGPGQGGYSQPEQQSVYLLHGGWYASCVHAGGLSCFVYFQQNWQMFMAVWMLTVRERFLSTE